MAIFSDSLRAFRNHFLSGLFILVPIGATVYVVWGIFNLLDGWLRDSQFVRSRLVALGLPQESTLYGVGFVTTILIILIVGFLGRLYVGRKMLSLVEMILSRIPVVSWIYNLVKQVSHAFLGRRKSIFERPVLIEYPRKGIYSLAFAVCDENGGMSRAVGKNLVCVFLATTPNPTSGFFLLVPDDEVIPITLTVEEAVRMVISSGMVNPSMPIDYSASEDEDEGQDLKGLSSKQVIS